MHARICKEGLMGQTYNVKRVTLFWKGLCDKHMHYCHEQIIISRLLLIICIIGTNVSLYMEFYHL